MRTTWTLRAAVLLTTVFAAGCSACRDQARSTSGADSGPRVATIAELTEAQRLWGVAPPPPGDGLVYQPEVVRLEGGPESIRTMAADGLSWVIDGQAGRDIQRGTILFATSRVAGRVLAVVPEGADLRVHLGPVELTDIYRDLTLSLDQPVDFANALPYDAPEYPGSTSIVGQRELASRRHEFEGGFTPVALFVEPGGFFRRVADQAPLRRFNVTPMVGPGGLGVRTTFDNGDVAITAQSVLYLSAPSLHLNIGIAKGVINVCELELRGAAGLLLSLEAATKVGLSGNFRHTEPSLPTEFSVPILMNKFSPFAINVRQAFTVHTGFGAKGRITSTGRYELGGSFRVGYRDGALSLGGPSRFRMTTNPAATLEGASLGATGLVLAHSVKVIVGVGAFGFATGPYIRLNSSLGISRDSDLVAMRMCRAASLGSSLAVGLGYVMPTAVTSVINVFLRALNLEEIKGEGGTETDPQKIIDSHIVVPPIAACGAEGTAAK